MITIDDLAKVDLRVGKIIEANRVENSEKLLKLQVEMGTETRIIFSGIAKTHSPEDLVGKRIIVVANLEPRKMMGEESQGMLLAAEGEDGPILLTTENEAPTGAKIH